MRSHAKAASVGSTTRQAIGLGRTGIVLACLLALLAVSGIGAPSAHAAKGWGFKETFGSAGKPKFGEDRSFAVDGSGRLLVLDIEEPALVSRWNPDGTPANFPGLGTNVIDGIRTGATNECPAVPADCDETPGNAGISSYFRAQVAVDSSGGATDGNIYVTDRFVSGGANVFSAAGAFLGRLTACSDKTLEGAAGVAVDGDGNVYFSGTISGFRVIAKYEPAANPPVNGDCVASREAAGAENLAAGAGPSDGYLFMSSLSMSKIEKRDTATDTFGALRYGLGTRPLVAVEPLTGHVFTTNESSVLEHDASGEEEAVEVARLEDAGSQVQAIAPAAAGELLYVGSEGSEEVDVYEAVPIPEATVGPPSAVSGAKATATGTVNPEGMAVTECFFEYGETTSYEQTAPCKESIPTDESDHQVSADLSGMLAHGATYHYRLVVKAPTGQDASEDEAFKTADTFFTDPAANVTETAATLKGTVRAEGVALTDCRFEWGKTTDYGQSAPCNPHFSAIPNDDADHSVGAAIAGLEPSTTYHYRLIAENSLGQIVAKDRTFTTQGAPTILEQRPLDATQTAVTLQARLNPSGIATTYHFEWGPEGSYPNRIPADHELFAGSGTEPVVLSANLTGLEPVSHYQFRVVATNAEGTEVGADQPFETLNEHGLPDNRAFELVTPVDKGPAGSLNSGFAKQLFFRASADGDSFIWPLQNGMPETTAGGWLRLKANRGADGWTSTQLSPPSLVEPPEIDGEGFANPSLLLLASDDGRCGFLETYNPLTPDTPAASVELGVHNLYLWRQSGDGATTYELVTDRLPLNPEAGNARNYEEMEAAEDCSRIYFKSTYEWIEGSSSLYEWEAATGAIRDAGLRPGSSVGPSLGLGDGGAVMGGEVDGRVTASWNAASPDGRRLFFTAINSDGRPAVFMRSDGGEEAGGSVVEISTSQTAVETIGARYEAASPDGSTVFFRANHGIAPGATSPGPINEPCGPLASETEFDNTPDPEAKPCDLYAYDVESEELSDLSADANPADPIGAAIQGTAAVDEDGSHAYFAALGQLIPDEGLTYAQNTAGSGVVNVYLYDSEAAPGEELSYVTNLRWGEFRQGAQMRNPDFWRASTSADGSALLYSATSRQSWYEGGGGQVAYLYDADREEIRCVSCRPDGEPTSVPPSGVVDFNGNNLLPLHLGRSRRITPDGSRAFFLSTDALTAGAEQGKVNLYEWEEGQVHFIAVTERAGDAAVIPEVTGYLGMSAGGEGVFFATNRKLAPHDRDPISDVYVAREGGGFPFAEAPPDCQVDESVPLLPNQIYCQGARSPQPPAPGSASAGFSGPGNPPASKEGKPRPRRCAKGKVRRRGKCVRRSKRAAKSERGRAANINRGGAK